MANKTRNAPQHSDLMLMKDRQFSTRDINDQLSDSDNDDEFQDVDNLEIQDLDDESEESKEEIKWDNIKYLKPRDI